MKNFFISLTFFMIFIGGSTNADVKAVNLSHAEYISSDTKCSVIKAAKQSKSQKHTESYHCYDPKGVIFEIVGLTTDFEEQHQKIIFKRTQTINSVKANFAINKSALAIPELNLPQEKEEIEQEIKELLRNAKMNWGIARKKATPILKLKNYYQTRDEIILTNDSKWSLSLDHKAAEIATIDALKADAIIDRVKSKNIISDAAMAEMAGEATVLVVHVVAPDKQTSATQNELSDSVFGSFGDPVNLSSQYDACSYNKKTFVPATGANITNGVVQLTITTNVTGASDGTIRNAVTEAGNALFGSLQAQADHVMLALPPGTDGSWIAYAYVDHWLSVYNNNWATYVSSQMHEIGHNLEMAHSNEADVEYGDQSGMMGFSYSNDDSPVMCFNAGKSSKFGWYSDKELTLDNESWSGKVIGLADYSDASAEQNVLLKIRTQDGNNDAKTLNLTYNRKKEINSGTLEGANKLLIVENVTPTRYNPTKLLAKLGSGESYTYANFWGDSQDLTVTVDSIGLDTNDVQYAYVNVDNGAVIELFELIVNDGTGDGNYSVGEVINITADAATSGQEFFQWVIESGSPTIAEISNADTTLTMSSEAVIISATYRDVYPLTVNNGTGDGSYAQGIEVAIEADTAPALQEFDRWVVDSGNATISALTNRNTTLTMGDGAAIISATYRDLPQLTVNNGTGDGTYVTGTEVTITADVPASNQEFSEWVIDSGDATILSATSSTTTLTTTNEDTTISAVYRTIYTLTVNNGSGDGSYPEGTEVAINADTAPNLQEFNQWVVDSGNVTLSSPTNKNTTLTMGAGAATITATYRDLPRLTVNNGTGGGSYVSGTQVAIVANEPDSGKEFVEWIVNSGSATIISPTSSSTTLMTSSEDTIISAVYRSVYVLTINSGTGSGIYAEGTSVDISANAAPPELEFDRWVVSSGNVSLSSSTAQTTTLIVGSGNATVTATYRNIYPLIVNNGSGDGVYPAGVNVTINAEPASNTQEFDQWQISSGSATIAVLTSPNTTLMTSAEATTVTATYRDIYTLTIDNGEGDGVFAAGIAVSITADQPPEGQEFDRWVIEEGDATITSINNSATTLTTGSANTIVIATYRNVFQLTVNNGIGSGFYPEGEIVNITPNVAPSGQEFDSWIVNSGGVTVANITNGNTTLVMGTEAAEITATYRVKPIVEESGGSGSNSPILLLAMLVVAYERRRRVKKTP